MQDMSSCSDGTTQRARVLQGSEAWKALRLGKATASRIADVVTRTKSGWGASRGNYAAELVTERLTRLSPDGYTNAAMDWGTAHEAEARAAYEFERNCDVELVDFVEHPIIQMSGASPDGLVGVDGLVEIKCPSSKTHIETLLGGTIPGKYVHQMQWQMACTGRAWCDFCSYDPRMPEHMRMFVQRLNRDDERIADLEREVIAFLAEVDETVNKLLALYPETRIAA